MHARLKFSKYIIALVLISIAFGSYGFSCKSSNPVVENKIRILARTEDDISQTLKSTAKIVKEAKEIGALNDEDIALLKPILKTVGESNLQAIEIAKRVNSMGELAANDQQSLLAIISFASDQLVQLNNEGTLRIKNPEKKLMFTTLVVTLQACVTSLVPLLVKGSK